MKNYFLNSLLDKETLLSRDQLKKIKGGYDQLFAAAGANCPDGSQVYCQGDICSATDNVGCSCTSNDGTKDEQKCDKKQ